MNKTNSDLLKYGIDTCSYLVARNQRMTNRQFATLIRSQFDNARALAVAEAFEATPGLVDRRWNGTVLELENALNKDEIAVRDAGLDVAAYSGKDGSNTGLFYLAASNGDPDTAIPGPYHDLASAWAAGAVELSMRAIEAARLADVEKQNRLAAAREAGYTASLENRSRASAQDASFMQIMKDDRGAQTMALLTQFAEGYQLRCDEEAAKIIAPPASFAPIAIAEASEDLDTLYGTILAGRNDRAILEGLGIATDKGVDLPDGGYEYSVKVSPNAMKELDPYWGTFVWELHPLKDVARIDADSFEAIPVDDMTEAQISAYKAYLHFNMRQLEGTSDSAFYAIEASRADEVLARKKQPRIANDSVPQFDRAFDI